MVPPQFIILHLLSIDEGEYTEAILHRGATGSAAPEGTKLIEVGLSSEDCLVVFLYINFRAHNRDSRGDP
jgi:hypothetical protein